MDFSEMYIHTFLLSLNFLGIFSIEIVDCLVVMTEIVKLVQNGQYLIPTFSYSKVIIGSGCDQYIVISPRMLSPCHWDLIGNC